MSCNDDDDDNQKENIDLNLQADEHKIDDSEKTHSFDNQSLRDIEEN